MSLLHVTTSFSGVSAAQGSIVLSLDVLLESFVSFSKRENFLANFVVLWLFVKIFSTKLGSVVFFGTAKASNPQKFLRKNRIFDQFMKVFSLKSFTLYGTAV